MRVMRIFCQLNLKRNNWLFVWFQCIEHILFATKTYAQSYAGSNLFLTVLKIIWISQFFFFEYFKVRFYLINWNISCMVKNIWKNFDLKVAEVLKLKNFKIFWSKSTYLKKIYDKMKMPKILTGLLLLGIPN